MKDFPDSLPDWDTLLAPHMHEKWGGLLYVDVPLVDAARRLRGRLVYLATPYSREVIGSDGRWCPVRSTEFGIRAAMWARRFAGQGVTAVSPIVQAVEMVHCGAPTEPDPLDAEFWEKWCRPLLAKADAVVVPPIQGWRASVGVWREAIEALATSRQVWLLQNDNGGEINEQRP